MKRFCIHRDGWLDGLEDLDDASTFSRVRISVGSANLTRNLSKRGGADSDAINVPLLPLAKFLASSWWTLLYEPFRSGVEAAFKARHRLDIPMHGYVFPKIAICSGGSQTLLTAWAQSPEDYTPIEFLAPASTTPEVLVRDQVEDLLMGIIETVLDRLNSRRTVCDELLRTWDSVRESMSDLDELAYCKAAGRLGLDPYDPESPDLTEFTSGISEPLFDDISDAVFVEELFETSKWIRSVDQKCRNAPSIDVAAFGEFPDDQLDLPAWAIGSKAAETFRVNIGITQDFPRRDLDQVFGKVLLAESACFSKGADSINALISREDGVAHIATVARSARQQRFRACTAAYIAWGAGPEEDRAATSAFTRHQQASRAFAAELLAPQEYLRSRVPTYGFTPDDIEDIAGELICPYETVIWQAYNSDIPLRGIEMPTPQHPSIV